MTDQNDMAMQDQGEEIRVECTMSALRVILGSVIS